jgi:hypothetical protein
MGGPVQLVVAAQLAEVVGEEGGWEEQDQPPGSSDPARTAMLAWT